MGIKRTVDWKLVCPPEEADARFRRAFDQLDLGPAGPPGRITGRSRRAMLKNRWAAEIDVDIQPLEFGCMAACTVDMLGTKHFAVLAELADALGDGLFDDRGAAVAVERLGAVSRLFGRKEIRHLRNLLRATEEVLSLGQGQYGNNQSLLVLTSERLFFFEKNLVSESTEEFPLTAITSMSVQKVRSGETLRVVAAGKEAEIKMMHGQADALVRAFHMRNHQASQRPAPSPQPADDPIAQLERLGQLRDKGLLSDSEFETKKTELLGRL